MEGEGEGEGEDKLNKCYGGGGGRKTIEIWWWWWGKYNRNVLVVVVVVKKNTRYVMVVDRGKINKRKNEGERRSWRWQLFNFCCHFLISKLGLCINLVQ